MDRNSYYTCVDSNRGLRVCFSDIRLPSSLPGQVYTITIPADITIRQHPRYIQKTLGKSDMTICIDGKTNIRVASDDHL
jgi:hypothetical protein